MDPGNIVALRQTINEATRVAIRANQNTSTVTATTFRITPQSITIIDGTTEESLTASHATYQDILNT